MKIRRALLTVLAVAMAPAAAEAACPITYGDFHEAVPHVDLMECPRGIEAPKEGFCRLALNGTEVTIYTFKLTRENACLTGAKHYTVDEYLRLKAEDQQAAQ